MSLNWNCKPLTDRGTNIWCKREDGEYLNPITESLIWATMVVGCDGRKIDTFIRRIRQYEIANGPLVRQPRPDYLDKAIETNHVRADSFTEDGYISAAELKRHDGFSTNASALTDAQWAKHLARIVAEDAESSLRREQGK